MSEQIKKLLELLEHNASIYHLCEELKLNRTELYELFRTVSGMGFEVYKKYYSDGDIIYSKKPHFNLNNNGETPIITNYGDMDLKIMLISDIHFGNDCEDINLINTIYEYCSKEGINVIINGGDIIDGITLGSKSRKKLHLNFYDQIEYMMNNYPRDDNILNFICLGNHDLDALVTHGQDLSKYLNNYRHDLIPLGYGLGKINIKNDTLVVLHELNNDSFAHKGLIFEDTIILKGHSHHFNVNYSCNTGNIIVKIPTLSNVLIHDGDLPGAVEMKLNFSAGSVSHVSFKQFVFGDKLHIVSNIDFVKQHTKKADSKKVHFEEKVRVRKIENEHFNK